MTDKPEHARAIAAVRLQNTEPPPAEGCLPGIAEILFRGKRETQKLEKQIQNAHLTLQHRAFLAGKKSDEAKDDVVAQLKVEFTTDFRNASLSPYFRDRNDTFGARNSDLVHRTVDEATRNDAMYRFLHCIVLGGGHFNASKNDSEARHSMATQIRTENGHLYELINTPTKEQAREIEQQSGVSINQKGDLAERDFYPKVRFARDLYNDNYVAVKKREAPLKHFYDEIDGYELAGKSGTQNRQMQFLDAAVCRKSRFSKGYLFMPLMNRGNGEAAAKRIAALRSVSSEQARAKLLWTAKEYAGAVADLHAKNLYHHDIKPSNFLHDERPHPKSDPAIGEAAEEIIKLSDFETLAIEGGLAGTAQYMCPRNGRYDLTLPNR